MSDSRDYNVVLIQKDALLCIDGPTNGPGGCERGVGPVKAGGFLLSQLQEVAQQCVCTVSCVMRDHDMAPSSCVSLQMDAISATL